MRLALAHPLNLEVRLAPALRGEAVVATLVFPAQSFDTESTRQTLQAQQARRCAPCRQCPALRPVRGRLSAHRDPGTEVSCCARK
jgi:hypothetical protein